MIGGSRGMTFDIEADWTLNLFCNYDCEYCFSRSDTEHSLVGRISPEQYLDFFNSTGKIWLFHLTGGEPFFHPDFVRLCQAPRAFNVCIAECMWGSAICERAGGICWPM